MRMTPLAPRLPYIAVAEASFSTSIEAISSGFIIESEDMPVSYPSMPPPVEVLTSKSGNPSRTISGAVEPVREFAPRISMLDSEPGFPDEELTIRPATPPAKASSTEKSTRFSKASALIEATAPVMSFSVGHRNRLQRRRLSEGRRVRVRHRSGIAARRIREPPGTRGS